MKNIKHITDFRLARFLLSGALNTTVNFAVLNIVFYSLHYNKFTSIVVATSCAIAVSFILNRNFVFLDKTRPAKRLLSFTVISVIGVFLIQNSIYALSLALFHGHDAQVTRTIQHFTNIKLSNSFVEINLSNLVASVTVMFWNYNGYRVFVFNAKTKNNGTIESLATETA